MAISIINNNFSLFLKRSLFVVMSMFLLTNIAMAKDAQIKWQEFNSKTIFAKSVKEKRPILLFVKADWCPHCTKMRETTLQDTSVIKLVNDSFIPVMVDADNDREMIGKYHVTGLPSFIILDSKDKILKSFSGEVTIVDFMQNLAQGHKQFANDKI